MAKQRWQHAITRDGRHHVLYIPERRYHTLTVSCRCEPVIDSQGSLVHRFGIALHMKLRAGA